MSCCEICGKPNSEKHHIIFRSQCRAMINCELNQVSLCHEHHRGTNGVHGREGRGLDIELKLKLQKGLYELFSNNYYHKDVIRDSLGISRKDVDILVKTLKWRPEGYEKIDIIRACMGGVIIC